MGPADLRRLQRAHPVHQTCPRSPYWDPSRRPLRRRLAIRTLRDRCIAVRLSAVPRLSGVQHKYSVWPVHAERAGAQRFEVIGRVVSRSLPSEDAVRGPIRKLLSACHATSSVATTDCKTLEKVRRRHPGITFAHNRGGRDRAAKRRLISAACSADWYATNITARAATGQSCRGGSSMAIERC